MIAQGKLKGLLSSSSYFYLGFCVIFTSNLHKFGYDTASCSLDCT